MYVYTVKIVSIKLVILHKSEKTKYFLAIFNEYETASLAFIFVIYAEVHHDLRRNIKFDICEFQRL